MKIFKTAIIGLGNIAHGYEDTWKIPYPTHLSALKKHKGFKLVSGCDVMEKNRKVFAKKVSRNIKLYSDYTEMIREEKPDFLIIATPTQTHYKIAMDAMKLGVKNIFCEKPICYSVKEAKKILSETRKRKVFIAFNYFRNYSISYNKLIDLLRHKKWGKILSMHVTYGKGVFNTATHVLAILMKLFDKVQIVKDAKVAGKKEIDPTINFSSKFDGIPCVFKGDDPDVSFIELNFICEKGIVQIVKDNLSEYIFDYKNGKLGIRQVKPKIEIDISRYMMEVYDNIYKHLVRRKKILCTPEHALKALEVAQKAMGKV